MTEQQLQEIEQRWAGEAEHRCPECNARPHREADVIDLLQEVRRLNRMVDKGNVLSIAVQENVCEQFPESKLERALCKTLCPGKKIAVCDALRKYLESEVADKC